MKILRNKRDVLVVSALAITLLSAFPLFSSSVDLKNEEKSEIKDIYQAIPDMEKGMYLIVGAFRIAENAVQYANSIKIDGKSPKLGKYYANKLTYVYAYETPDDLLFAREKRSELRAISKFHDTWILYVGISLEELEKKMLEANIKPEEVIPEEIIEPKVEEFIPPPPVAEGQQLYNYRFNVINASSLKEIPGYVTIIDAARNKAMKSVSTNQIHEIAAPTSQSKEIIALCDIFGFMKNQVTLKIDNPRSSADKNLISESGGITTVKFELVRHKVGDILTMYNVYFYTNAAIMKPESKYELNNLLEMLRENEKLELRIHGHTNGNSAGKIIKLKEDDKSYFKITKNNDEGTGSAKELSKARADLIVRWLIDQGIDKKRMSIKSWGGKKMLYDKSDSMAGRNVRVEVEILKG